MVISSHDSTKTRHHHKSPSIHQYSFAKTPNKFVFHPLYLHTDPMQISYPVYALCHYLLHNSMSSKSTLYLVYNPNISMHAVYPYYPLLSHNIFSTHHTDFHHHILPH